MVMAKFPIPGQLLGLALVMSVLSSGCGGSSKAGAPPPLNVKVQTLERSALMDSTEYVGALESRQRVNLAPRINGRILKIYVQEGDRVRQGQVLVELRPTKEAEEVRSARGDVLVARANVAQAEAELKAAEAERARAAADVAEAQATVIEARSEARLAKDDYERWKMTTQGGATTVQSLDQKRTAFESQIANVTAQQQALASRQKALQVAEQRVIQSLANVEAQQGSVISAQGSLGSTAQNLSFNFIYAPVDGIVGDFNTKKVGDFVNVGETITTITDNKSFLLNVNIPTELRDRLRLGTPVEIVKDDKTPGPRGQVNFISPRVDPNTQSVLAKFAFVNDGTLRDRQYVRTRVIWNLKPGVLVPTQAVSRLGGQAFVFVKDETTDDEGKPQIVAKQVPVTLGSIQGQAYQVLSGVKPGDQIITSRILDLVDGRPITVEGGTNSS